MSAKNRDNKNRWRNITVRLYFLNTIATNYMRGILILSI